jgi:hypothetical protein
VPKQVPSICLWTFEGSGYFTSWDDTLFLSRYKRGSFAWRIQRDGIDDPGRFTIWRSTQFRKGREGLMLLRAGLADDQLDHPDQSLAQLVRLIPKISQFDSRLGAEFAEALAAEVRMLATNVIPIRRRATKD